jgi:hypothetical protein
VRVARDLGVILEARRAPLDLVEVLDARLAALEGQDSRQLRPVGAQQAGRLVEQLAALEGRQTAPPALSRRCHAARAGDIAFRRVGHLAHELEGGWIDHAPQASGRRGAPHAVDPECLHGVQRITRRDSREDASVVMKARDISDPQSRCRTRS